MLPTDPFLYLAPLSLITLVASYVQIQKNESDLKARQQELDQKIYETLKENQIEIKYP